MDGTFFYYTPNGTRYEAWLETAKAPEPPEPRVCIHWKNENGHCLGRLEPMPLSAALRRLEYTPNCMTPDGDHILHAKVEPRVQEYRRAGADLQQLVDAGRGHSPRCYSIMDVLALLREEIMTLLMEVFPPNDE